MSTSSPSLRFRFRPSPRAGPGACPDKGKAKGKEVVLTRRRVGGFICVETWFEKGGPALSSRPRDGRARSNAGTKW